MVTKSFVSLMLSIQLSMLTCKMERKRAVISILRMEKKKKNRKKSKRSKHLPKVIVKASGRDGIGIQVFWLSVKCSFHGTRCFWPTACFTRWKTNEIKPWPWTLWHGIVFQRHQWQNLGQGRIGVDVISSLRWWIPAFQKLPRPAGGASCHAHFQRQEEIFFPSL